METLKSVWGTITRVHGALLRGIVEYPAVMLWLSVSLIAAVAVIF